MSHPEAVKDFLRREASWERRRAYVWVLLAASMTTAVVVSLLLTEPNLPLRTRAAFAVLSLLGATWSGFAIWVLSRKSALFAVQRVWAGRLAVLGSSLFTAGAAAVQMFGNVQAWPAVLFGLSMIAVALVVLSHGQREHQALLLLRASLEQEIRV